MQIKTERSMRFAALQSARNTLIEEAARIPEEFARALSNQPELLNGIDVLQDIVETLNKHGQREVLESIQQSKRVSPRVRRVIADVLLAG